MTFVSDVVSLNDGVLVGRTRLQKSVYFLEAFEAGCGYEFDYHHYGPYCDELAADTDDAVALGELSFEWKKGGTVQPYAVYKSAATQAAGDAVADKRRAILKVLGNYDALTLELAATADFLRRAGQEDPWAETKRRKPAKSSPERFARAQKLLSDLESFGA